MTCNFWGVETFNDLIAALGGPSLVANEMGLTPSAVTNWRMRGRVSRSHVLSLWELALKKGLDWTPPDAVVVRDLLLRSQSTPKIASQKAA